MSADIKLIDTGLPAITLCHVPDPEIPSSAFTIFRSEPVNKSGYWVEYRCKQACENWQECLVPAYSDDNGQPLMNGRAPETAKQALAFVVDKMGGHIALSSDGEKTVFIHTGAGGTRYYIKPAQLLEEKSNARTVMIRWEKGYISPLVQPPFTKPIAWGWYSRTSKEATNIRNLNKRVASIIAWSHKQLSGTADFGTFGCSMGTNATFGPVLWHGLDPIIDYQLFVGGPNMWDLNTQCNRRQYNSGYCAKDGTTKCTSDSDCNNTLCAVPGPYTTIDKLFEQLPNHIHVTDACDIRSAHNSPYKPFDDSSMAYAESANWEIDHPVDFVINIGAKQGNDRSVLGGDEYWALGHFPPVFNKVKPDANKTWHSIPDSHHCGAMFNDAIGILIQQMDL